MDFDLTSPAPLPDDSHGSGDSQNADLQAPAAPQIPDHVLEAIGMAPDGSIHPGAVDALIDHARNAVDYLVNEQAGSRSVPSGVATPNSPSYAGAPYRHEDVLAPVPPTASTSPAYGKSQEPATPVSEVIVTAPRSAAVQGASGAVQAVSDRGAAFIRDYEKLGPTNKSNTITYEYGDAVKKPTIGWGHLLPEAGLYPNGMDIGKAKDVFADDLKKYSDLVRSRVKVPLSQNQFDALTSLAYNAPSALKLGSGFLTTLNKGDYQGAAAIIPQYNKGRVSSGAPLKVINGLTTRRNAERAMFLDGDYNSKH